MHWADYLPWIRSGHIVLWPETCFLGYLLLNDVFLIKGKGGRKVGEWRLSKWVKMTRNETEWHFTLNTHNTHTPKCVFPSNQCCLVCLCTTDWLLALMLLLTIISQPFTTIFPSVSFKEQPIILMWIDPSWDLKSWPMQTDPPLCGKHKGVNISQPFLFRGTLV